MSEEILEQLRKAIVELDDQRAADIAREGIDAGIEPMELINNGIRTALDIMGERFSTGELFLPELMLSAKAADAAVEILEPELIKRGATSNRLGRVLIATVKGDIHDIGKNIVALLLKSAGFDVIDIGVDRSEEEILSAAKTHSVSVIGLSALLTTTMPRMKEFMEYLPYAIALGVEKKWAKQFESITIPQPEWYKGADTFVAHNFASEMSSFSKLVTSSVATKTSGGSGVSGGGSGGGSGGSW